MLKNNIQTCILATATAAPYRSYGSSDIELDTVLRVPKREESGEESGFDMYIYFFKILKTYVQYFTCVVFLLLSDF